MVTEANRAAFKGVPFAGLWEGGVTRHGDPLGMTDVLLGLPRESFESGDVLNSLHEFFTGERVDAKTASAVKRCQSHSGRSGIGPSLVQEACYFHCGHGRRDLYSSAC